VEKTKNVTNFETENVTHISGISKTTRQTGKTIKKIIIKNKQTNRKKLRINYIVLYICTDEVNDCFE